MVRHVSWPLEDDKKAGGKRGCDGTIGARGRKWVYENGWTWQLLPGGQAK